MIKEDYYGRLFTQQTLPECIKNEALSLDSFTKKSGQLVCQRCATNLDHDAQLPNGDYYCRSCIVFGRNTTGQDLYYVPQRSFPKLSPLNWSGELTPYQKEVSDTLLSALSQKKSMLVHAVTGAGKTEMIYQTVANVIAQGGAVALVSPRIDVCNELYARFCRDFTCQIALLHGGTEAYQRSPLVISTVHQLYYFYQAFDLIIVDEVDAFPYVDNLQLYQAVKNALKPSGLNVYLTATSTDYLEREVRSKRLEVAHLSRRFHGNPLVVPKTRWLSGFLKYLERGKLPHRLLSDIVNQRQTGYPLLLFFPHIELGQQFVAVLKNYFPDDSIDFVSSETENRLEIVTSFREKRLDILVSTTILERGVTFPCVDVYVLWSNHKLFNRSSLVQIAGRVGRSPKRPTGQLIFYHDGITRSIKKAISEIKLMNQKGGFNELPVVSK